MAYGNFETCQNFNITYEFHFTLLRLILKNRERIYKEGNTKGFVKKAMDAYAGFNQNKTKEAVKGYVTDVKSIEFPSVGESY